MFQNAWNICVIGLLTLLDDKSFHVSPIVKVPLVYVRVICSRLSHNSVLERTPKWLDGQVSFHVPGTST